MASAGQPGPPEAFVRPPSAASSEPKTLVEHLEDEDDTSVYAILMPADYHMKPGAPLWKGVRLGKFLGAGVQAKVFQLAREDNTPIGKVIKINHGDIGSKMLNNNVLWIGMDREWEIGTQLRAALQEPGGQVPGFMKVCDCLVTRRGHHAAFGGMLMEELHGWEVYKRIDTPEFHNIHYVREMLYQTFSALDRAQRKMGFHHADLGMRNIMEHYPTIWEQHPKEEEERAKAEAAKRPGYSVNADGSRLPLGPAVEFKIIDFGVAKFSAKLAAAAGGPEAEEAVERLHERQREKIRFGSANSPTSIEFEPSDVTKDQPTTSRLRRLFNMPGKSRLTVIVRPVVKPVQRTLTMAAGVIHRNSEAGSNSTAANNSAAADAASSAAGDAEAAAEAGLPAAPSAASLPEEAALKAEWQPVRLVSIQEPSFKQAADTASQSRGKRLRRKRKSPIETMYRHFWHRKGDVFHLLLGIALALDDRCWPEEDEDEVAALCSLVHHVTGIKMRARTAAAGDGTAVFGRRKWQHWFRRWAIRLKAHILPYNSGLLAREALSHPFFSHPVVRHADLPAPLTKVFPPDEE